MTPNIVTLSMIVSCCHVSGSCSVGLLTAWSLAWRSIRGRSNVSLEVGTGRISADAWGHGIAVYVLPL